MNTPAVMEANKNLVRRVFQEFWNEQNEALVDELYAAGFVDHIPGLPPEFLSGPEGLKRNAASLRAAFPDAHFTIDDILADGDKVVTRWTVRGTHQGEMNGIPPTGRHVTVTAMSIDQIVGEKVVESWTIYDARGLLQQLGVIPQLA